jgi:two-component system OmpR family response regulator
MALPPAPVSPAKAGTPKADSGPAQLSGESPGPARILLVEDDLEMAGLVEQALWDDGYMVERAGDGLSALELARRVAYDAVVLDVLLPGLDGRDVCRTLREEGRPVPVMMLTALGEVVDRVHGLDVGADDYLPKPFSLEELLARLRALIRRGRRQRPEALRAGPLSLDRLSGRVWRGDVEVELTTREVALLELFLRWPGIVLARDTLMAHVWGDEPGRSSNLVTQYVGHLRRKLNLPYAGSDLETIHRLGYRLTVGEPS